MIARCVPLSMYTHAAETNVLEHVETRSKFKSQVHAAQTGENYPARYYLVSARCANVDLVSACGSTIFFLFGMLQKCYKTFRRENHFVPVYCTNVAKVCRHRPCFSCCFFVVGIRIFESLFSFLFPGIFFCTLRPYRYHSRYATFPDNVVRFL